MTLKTDNVQIGVSGTSTDNFTIRQPSTPDGTVRIANGNSGTTTDLVTINSSGNVGIGSTTPAASDIGPTVRLGERLILISQAGNSAYHTDNLYYNSGWKYAANGYGTVVRMVDGQYIISNAPSNSSGAAAAATVTEQFRVDASGNLKFNSNYGSVAAAYGCRAWVKFQGTGTVTINYSANVSSITDAGTGIYYINFTNAMTDINYCPQLSCWDDGVSATATINKRVQVGTASQVQVFISDAVGTGKDANPVFVTVHR